MYFFTFVALSGRHKMNVHGEELGGCDGVLNQYWYSEHTTSVMVAAIAARVREGGRIAFLSTPSLFFAMPPALQANSILLEYDKRWAGRSEFRFFDFNDGVGGMGELFGSFDLCVIDPPYIDKPVWIKYLEAANQLLHADGDVLCTSIPENEPMIEAVWRRAQRGTHIQSHKFVPVNAECLHRFAVFTTFASPSFAVLNEEFVPDSQGLGQQLAQTAMRYTGTGGETGDDITGEVDEVDGMFGGLQQAVISMHLDHNDSEHESEPSEEDIEGPEYEFNKKTGRVMKKKEAARGPR